jgi:membrane associated rhomboid family serine protease
MSVKEQKAGSSILLGQDNNNLLLLFAINAIVFVVFKFVFVIYQMSELDVKSFNTTLFNWFILPSNIRQLANRPWALLTHFFTDNNIMSLLPNMCWLWVFGYVLQDLAGNKKIIPIYLYGGLVGGLFYIAAYYAIPSLQNNMPAATFMGANASVMAIAIATTALKPDYKFFPLIMGGIPLWAIALIFVTVDMVAIPPTDFGRYIAHLAGAATGFIFIYQLRRGKDGSVAVNRFFDWCSNLFSPHKPTKRTPATEDFFYKVKGTRPYQRTPNITQKRIDDILDKINQEGYHLLTDEEKDILRRTSEEDEL